MADRYDVLAFGAHPDDLEVVMGGTAAEVDDLWKKLTEGGAESQDRHREVAAGVRRVISSSGAPSP